MPFVGWGCACVIRANLMAEMGANLEETLVVLVALMVTNSKLLL